MIGARSETILLGGRSETISLEMAIGIISYRHLSVVTRNRYDNTLYSAFYTDLYIYCPRDINPLPMVIDFHRFVEGVTSRLD